MFVYNSVRWNRFCVACFYSTQKWNRSFSNIFLVLHIYCTDVSFSDFRFISVIFLWKCVSRLVIVFFFFRLFRQVCYRSRTVWKVRTFQSNLSTRSYVCFAADVCCQPPTFSDRPTKRDSVWRERPTHILDQSKMEHPSFVVEEKGKANALCCAFVTVTWPCLN